MATEKKRKAREKNVLANETPEKRFTRLATARVSAAIKRIRLIKNLAGPSYKFTGEQVEKISTVLESELQSTLKAFAARMSTGEEVKEEIFSL